MDNVSKLIPLINLDTLFVRSTNAECINDVSEAVLNFNEHVNSKLFSSMDGQIEFSASCECGKLCGNHFAGRRCGNCGTVASSAFVDHLSHKNWLGIPDKMPPVIHPIMYLVLKDFLKTIDRVPILDIILNPALEVPESLKHIIRGQGFTYFYKNHMEILTYFFDTYKKTAKKSDECKEFFFMYYDVLFCTKLPILDPVLHPISRTGVNKINIDQTASYALNAINSLTYSLYERKRSITSKGFVDRTLWKVYSNYLGYINSIITAKLGGKQGHLRKQMFGIRTHFSFRSVIVPFTTCHMADEVLLPWAIGVHTFKLHLLNHLTLRHGYTYADAIAKYQHALVQYDEEIHKILDTILAEAPPIKAPNQDNSAYSNSTYGIPILFGRNPSLTYGSIYKMRIVGFKTDLNDHTIAFSSLVVGCPNADYDGDEMYGLVLFEGDMARAFNTLHPKEMLMSRNRPTADDRIRITVPALVSLGAFLAEEDDYLEEIEFDYTHIPETKI